MHASTSVEDLASVPPEPDREQFAARIDRDQPAGIVPGPAASRRKGASSLAVFRTPLLPLLGMTLVVLLDGIIDRALGANIGTSLLMVVPIYLAVRVGGAQVGILTAALGFLLWLVFDALALSSLQWRSLPVESAGIHLAIYSSAIALATEHRRLLAERSVATTDFLTGVANRRGFYETLAREIERSRRYQTPMTLLYLDCDEFKAVNDRMGHPSGNWLLVRIAATLKENTRALDVVGRLGGDEFAVLLVETPAERGHDVAERLQRAMRFVLGPEAPSVTFSIGAMTFDSAPTSPTEALRVADALMYEAKRAGKDRVVHAVTC